MRDLPIVAKMIINIVLYMFYVLFASIVFSFVFPLVLQVLWRPLLSPVDPVFTKIQVFIALLVLLISLILRKYFYLWKGNQKVVYSESSYTATKSKKKQTSKKPVEKKVLDSDEEEIKIYVEKEIK